MIMLRNKDQGERNKTILNKEIKEECRKKYGFRDENI